jgi:hypothetical protein
MWMIRGEVAMSETTFEMEGKATRSNRVILDIGKVETFANMLIHLLLLSKFRGLKTLMWTYGRRDCGRSVRSMLCFESGVGICRTFGVREDKRGDFMGMTE